MQVKSDLETKESHLIEKTIFHIDFDVLILSADFQTEPPPPNAI